MPSSKAWNRVRSHLSRRIVRRTSRTGTRTSRQCRSTYRWIHSWLVTNSRVSLEEIARIVSNQLGQLPEKWVVQSDSDNQNQDAQMTREKVQKMNSGLEKVRDFECLPPVFPRKESRIRSERYLVRSLTCPTYLWSHQTNRSRQMNLVTHAHAYQHYQELKWLKNSKKRPRRKLVS